MKLFIYMKGYEVKKEDFLSKIQSVIERNEHGEDVFEPEFYVSFLLDEELYTVEIIDIMPYNNLYVIEIY